MRHVDAKLVQGVRKRATPASERKGGGGGGIAYAHQPWALQFLLKT